MRARLDLTSSTVVAALAFLAFPTLVLAHAGNNDPNVIHACVKNATAAVRIVGVYGTCVTSPPKSAETPLHWAIQGPQGPQGLTGADGTPGVPGTNGTSVTFLGTFSGAQNGCPNGGSILGTANGNAYICNGTSARPDPPCFGYDRYTDCGNGTVTDAWTGLIWLKQADCLGVLDWASANGAAAGLKHGVCGLTDGSSAGDWRLPTMEEWQKMVARANAMNCEAPALTDDIGNSCFGSGAGSSFVGVLTSFPQYPCDIGGCNNWSSTGSDENPRFAFAIGLWYGNPGFNNKLAIDRAWPVRGASR